MKIKTSVTEQALTNPNPFGIEKNADAFVEVVVRAYDGKTGESVTMSFPRETAKYKKDSPEVVAATKKAVDMTTNSLVKYLEAKEARKTAPAKETKTAQ